MSERPKLTGSILWTIWFGLSAVGGGVLATHAANGQVIGGIIIGGSIGIILFEWSSFSWRRLIADYGDVIEQYETIVADLTEQHPVTRTAERSEQQEQ